jgi:hypothetical protein
MDAIKPETYHNYSNYKTWEGRWELIDEMAYDMSPAPYPKYQKVVAKFTSGPQCCLVKDFYS